MDLLPNEQQTAVVDTVSRFLADRLPVKRLVRPRGQEREGTRQDHDAWRDLAALGCFGVALDADAGGLGMGPGEAALVFREFGRVLLTPSALATTVAAQLAHAAGNTALVAALLEGRQRAALAVPSADFTGSGAGLATVECIDAGAGDHVLVCGDTTLELLSPDMLDAGQALEGMDETLALSRRRRGAAAPIARADALTSEAGLAARVLSAAMLVGIAEATRDAAVAHAGTREQFGRAIGSFQAIKHRCVDMALRAESAWSQTVMAALSCGKHAADALFQSAAAKITATTAALDNARAGIQIYGAMGFTAEIEAHLFLKRAHVLDAVCGNLRMQRTTLMQQPAPL